MNLIIWEMLRFFHQCPIAWENATKPTVWGEPRKLVIIFSPWYGYFFPFRFPSYGILHHVGNAWVFSSISHSTGKCNNTHCMGKTQKIGNHAFPIAWVLFYHPIPILWYTSSYGKIYGFSYEFLIVQENSTKPILWGGPAKLVLILLPQYGCFFPIQFTSCGMLHYMGNAWVFPSISYSTKKFNKTHHMGRTWEIVTNNFSIVWVVFSCQISILWSSSLHGKCMSFLINFQQHGKIQQK